MKRFWLFVYLVLIINYLSVVSALAQGTVAGCLIPYNDRVYTVNSLEILGTSQLYNKNTYISLSNNYCTWTPGNTAVSCVICDGLLGADALGLKICLLGSFRYGYKGTFTMIECNLDDYSWPLATAAGIFGIFIIRRRNKF